MFDIETDIPQPKDKGIILQDIITSGRVERVKSYCIYLKVMFLNILLKM
jgi:hypothetical protein